MDSLRLQDDGSCQEVCAKYEKGSQWTERSLEEVEDQRDHKPQENDAESESEGEEEDPEPLLIFYDLEFCGHQQDITQIGAVCPELKSEFKQYILPTDFPNPEEREPVIINRIMAIQLTKVIDTWDRGERRLYHIERQEFLPSVSLSEGLTRFLTFLMTALNMTDKQVVHLFNYGGQDYDILIKNLRKCKLTVLKEFMDEQTRAFDVQNFVDDFMGSSQTGLKRAFKHFNPNEDYVAHDAINDAKATHQVYENLKQSKSFKEKIRVDDSHILTCFKARKEVEDIVKCCVEMANPGWLETLIEKTATSHSASVRKTFDSPLLRREIKRERDNLKIIYIKENPDWKETKEEKRVAKRDRKMRKKEENKEEKRDAKRDKRKRKKEEKKAKKMHDKTETTAEQRKKEC